MCRQCHPKNKSVTLAGLKKCINDPKFHVWNTTSVHHTLISLNGEDGKESQKLAYKLLEKYYIWYKSNKYDRYMPKTGLEPMYPKSFFKDLLENINIETQSQEILEKFINTKCNEYKNKPPQYHKYFFVFNCFALTYVGYKLVSYILA
jgi:uncharacterized protein YdiU (UPF0061 family)